MFDVSVNYLLGEGQHTSYDKETLKRLQDIENLDSDTKKMLFDVIDSFIRESKGRKAFAHYKSPELAGLNLPSKCYAKISSLNVPGGF